MRADLAFNLRYWLVPFVVVVALGVWVFGW